MNLGKQPPKKHLRAAIRQKCIECMGGPRSPGFRAEIANCSSIYCPLKPYRPFQDLLQKAS